MNVQVQEVWSSLKLQNLSVLYFLLPTCPHLLCHGSTESNCDTYTNRNQIRMEISYQTDSKNFQAEYTGQSTSFHHYETNKEESEIESRGKNVIPRFIPKVLALIMDFVTIHVRICYNIYLALTKVQWKFISIVAFSLIISLPLSLSLAHTQTNTLFKKDLGLEFKDS